MPLRMLPDIVFPVTLSQVNPLMDCVHQFNILDAGLNEKWQRGMGLMLHTFDLWVKSKGKIDYRGPDGHRRLVDDAMTFVGHGNPVATRHGDLAAAHLSIDWSDTQVRLTEAGWPLLSDKVADLLRDSMQLSEHAPEIEKRVGLYMDYLGKKAVPK